jgi:hypothetical protein
MISNQDRSKEIAHAIRNWISERDEKGDWGSWIQTVGPKAYRGVKRSELAAKLEVSKTSLNENEAADELRNAEIRWCTEFRKKEETSQAASAELRRARDSDKWAQKRAISLEGTDSELKAENRVLRSRLARYEAIEKVLIDTARAPREAFTTEE